MKWLLSFVLIFITFNSQAKLTNESEISLIKTGGNSTTQTYGVKSKSVYSFGVHDIELSGEYNFAQNDNITSKENWNLGAKYEHLIFNSLGIFLGEIVEGDRFKGISRRYNSDLGLSYAMIKSDKRNLKGQFGYRFTKEKTVDGNEENYSKARIFISYDESMNNNVKFKYWVELLPNFSEGQDYIVSMEPAVEIVLAKELFVKLSYGWKYDHLPEAGKAKADYTFKTSLLATF